MLILRRAMGVGICVTVLGIPALAAAQPHQTFGDQGQLIFGADRLVPLLTWEHASVNQQVAGSNVSASSSTDETSLSLLWGQTDANSFYTVPRVGFDYAVVDNITVGGEFMFATSLGNTQTDNVTTNGRSQATSQDRGTQWAFGIAPRAGYVLYLTDLLSIWLRGGFSFYYLNSSQPAPASGQPSVASSSRNQFALDLEPQLVFTPVSHVGFTAGLLADIPIVGQTSNPDPNNVSASVSNSSSYWHIGLSLGLIGYL